MPRLPPISSRPPTPGPHEQCCSVVAGDIGMGRRKGRRGWRGGGGSEEQSRGGRDGSTGGTGGGGREQSRGEADQGHTLPHNHPALPNNLIMAMKSRKGVPSGLLPGGPGKLRSSHPCESKLIRGFPALGSRRGPEGMSPRIGVSRKRPSDPRHQVKHPGPLSTGIPDRTHFQRRDRHHPSDRRTRYHTHGPDPTRHYQPAS